MGEENQMLHLIPGGTLITTVQYRRPHGVLTVGTTQSEKVPGVQEGK